MQKTKKGFTLIELITVIVILAIILLISIPIIGGLIDNAKRASLESSARIIIKEIKHNLVSNVNFELDSVNENTIKNYVNVDSDNFSKVNVKEESEDIYITIDGKDSYDGYSVCGTYQKLYVNQPEMCSADVAKTCTSLTKAEMNQKISEGYIPVASKEDLAAINSYDTHTFAVGTEYETETKGGANKLYIQIKNIDLSGTLFIPLGATDPGMEPVFFNKDVPVQNLLNTSPKKLHQMDFDEVKKGFTGEYYGNCYSVDNMTIDEEQMPYPMSLGFFSNISGNAFISNVVVNNATIIGTRYVGILAGSAEDGSFIENSRVNGKIIVNNGSARSIGGLIGELENSQVLFSKATVDIEMNGSENSYIGGLIGHVFSASMEPVSTQLSKIIKSSATVDIKSVYSSCVGGLIGDSSDINATIENVYSRGIIDNPPGAGGLIGCLKGKVNNAFSTVVLVNPYDGYYLYMYEQTHRFVHSYTDKDAKSINSFYTTDIADLQATKVSEAEFLAVNSYPNWDFVNTWTMSSTGPELKGLIYKNSGEDCFTFDSESGAITGYDNYCPKDVVIPEKINGITVTKIGEGTEVLCSPIHGGRDEVMPPYYENDGSYSSCRTLNIDPPFKNKRITSLTLPNTITHISSYAFANNKIQNLVLPSSLANIGAEAFKNNMIRNLDLPNSLLTIEKSVFENNLISSLRLPENIEFIGNNSFARNQISALIIPDGVRIIGDWSFGSNAIKNITLPNSLEIIGIGAFSDNLIETLNIPNSVYDINFGAFTNNLINNLTLPSTIAYIDSSTFSSNRLMSITIPNTVERIHSSAFSNNLLTELLIPSSVLEIDYSAFANNLIKQGDLKIDNISGNINIGFSAFRSNGENGNEEITPVYVGSTELCFTLDEANGIITGYNNNCPKDVIIPETVRGVTVRGIASTSEMSCKTHDDMYTIVTEVQYYQNKGQYKSCWTKDWAKSPFGNKQITSVSFPNTVEYIGEETFNDNLISSLVLPSSLKYFSGFNRNEITSITIPQGVETITGCALGENLLTSVTIPSSVKNIGNCAFRENKITSLTIPSNVISIGEQAFGHNLITSLNIPEGVTRIDENAFEYNQIGTLNLPNTLIELGGFYQNKITSLTIPSSVKKISNRAFGGNLLTNLVIPSNVTSMSSSVFQSNKLESLTINANITTIGTQSFYNNLLTSVIIPNTVTEIGLNAFNGNRLTSITLPTGLRIIGNSAFRENSITEVILPNTVTEIGPHSFASNLINNLVLPNNISRIEQYAFHNNKLTNIALPSTLNFIGEGAFRLNLLTSVTIPNSVTSIGTYAFESNQINNLLLPNSINRVENYAFQNNKLTSIVIPSTVQVIGTLAFANNLIETLTVPSSVTTLDGFQNNRLTTLTIPSTVRTIGQNAFTNNLLTTLTIQNGTTVINANAFMNNSLTSVLIPNSVTSIGSSAFRQNNITAGNARIDNRSGFVSVGIYAFHNNGPSKTTTITPTYLR